MVTILLFGVYSAAAAIVVTLISYFTGMDPAGPGMWFSWLSTVALIVFLWLAMKERKTEEFGGTITYGQCIGTGTMMGVVTGIIVAIFMFFYVTQINPGMIDGIMQKNMQAWQARGMTSEQISKAQSMTKMMTSPSMMAIFALLADIFFAFIFSLIIGLFMRSKEEEINATA